MRYERRREIIPAYDRPRLLSRADYGNPTRRLSPALALFRRRMKKLRLNRYRVMYNSVRNGHIEQERTKPDHGFGEVAGHQTGKSSFANLFPLLDFDIALHARDLPGRPDLVFRKARKAIFVHGCFWHRHKGCQIAVCQNQIEFLAAQLRGNKIRDFKNQKRLKKLKWKNTYSMGMRAKKYGRFAETPEEVFGPPAIESD